MCNCKGKCGCNITQITKGEKGDVGLAGTNGANGENGTNGTNGTNAFKFVKRFDYDGSAPLEIPYAQITSCASIPEGCFPDGTTYNQYVDYHVQLWKFIPETESPAYWELYQYINYTYTINPTTGDVTLYFNVQEQSGIYRLVILA